MAEQMEPFSKYEKEVRQQYIGELVEMEARLQSVEGGSALTLAEAKQEIAEALAARSQAERDTLLVQRNELLEAVEDLRRSAVGPRGYFCRQLYAVAARISGDAK